MATPRNLSETKVVYGEGELTYAERQLRDFFAPQKQQPRANVAPGVKPLRTIMTFRGVTNGKRD